MNSFGIGFLSRWNLYRVRSTIAFAIRSVDLIQSLDPRLPSMVYSIKVFSVRMLPSSD